jgi:isopentenyl diphosphate isomerase/L-lactate dehydrogenase-like FMN-dependent dehydrogenase
MKKPAESDLMKLANAAFRQAARKVIELAKQTGTPVIVWEDGEIKRLDPRKIRLPGVRRKRRPRAK